MSSNDGAGSGRIQGAKVVEADDLMREDPELVFFRACRHGPTWPHKMRHYSGEVNARSMTWPAWLPYAHPRDLAPLIAGVHIHWPRAVEGDATQVAPDQSVAVMVYRGPWTVPVRTMLRRAGWVDMSDLWHAAAEVRRTVLARPEVPVVQALEAALEVVSEVVTRARTRRQAAVSPVGA